MSSITYFYDQVLAWSQYKDHPSVTIEYFEEFSSLIHDHLGIDPDGDWDSYNMVQQIAILMAEDLIGAVLEKGMREGLTRQQIIDEYNRIVPDFAQRCKKDIEQLSPDDIKKISAGMIASYKTLNNITTH